MKIFDIICEGPAPTPAPPGMKWNGTMWVPNTAADTASDKPNFKRRPARRKKNRTAPPDVPGKTGPTPSSEPSGIDKIKERWRTNAQRYAKYTDEGVTKRINQLGKITKYLLKAAGFLIPIEQLYSELAKLELDYVEGLYPFNTGDDEADLAIYNERRNWFWGRFMATEGAVLAAQTLAWALRSIFWGRIAKNIVTFISAGVTFGTSIAFSLATEAGIAWMSKWLSTPEGEQWWRESFIGPLLRFGGAVLDTAWQGLVMAYTKGTTGQAQSSNDIAQDRRDNRRSDPNYVPPPTTGLGTQSEKLPDKPPESQSKINWPSNIRNWNNGGWTVGGEQVTDGKGYLIPGIQNVISVQGARAEAKRKGLPDPLADLPAAPGKQHPGEYVD